MWDGKPYFEAQKGMAHVSKTFMCRLWLEERAVDPDVLLNKTLPAQLKAPGTQN